EEHRSAVKAVHPDAVAEQRAAALAPGRVDREDGDLDLVLLVDAKASHELVGERGLARTAGAGDPEHRDRTTARRVAQCRDEVLVLAGLDDGEGAGDGALVAGEDRVELRRLGREIDVALLDDAVDHADQAELLPVLGPEDRDAAIAQLGDL